MEESLNQGYKKRLEQSNKMFMSGSLTLNQTSATNLNKGPSEATMMDGSQKTSHRALLNEHREQSLQNLVNVYQTKLKEEHS